MSSAISKPTLSTYLVSLPIREASGTGWFQEKDGRLEEFECPLSGRETRSFEAFAGTLLKHLPGSSDTLLVETDQPGQPIAVLLPRLAGEDLPLSKRVEHAFRAKWRYNPCPENAPGVSIIIPSYNYAHFLPDALESLVSQDYPLFEIIVIDDGSSDNTAEVARSFGEKVRYIYQDNKGLPASRNSGIKFARHPFVAFVDADDLWLPGTLRAMMTAFNQEASDCSLVGTAYFVMDGKAVITPKSTYFQHKSGKITREDLLLKNRFHASGIICRKQDLLEAGYFEETMRSSEDRDTWVRLAARRDLFLLEEANSLYRVHGNNMSQNTERMKKHMRMVFQCARRRSGGREGGLFWSRIRSFYLYQASCMYHDAGERWKAIRDLTASLLLWPWFQNPNQLHEPSFFRLRSYARYLFR